MKPKWNNEEIIKLFDIVEKNNKKNKPLMSSFKEYALLSNRNMFSIRNFYYAFLKILEQNCNLQKTLNIDISKHKPAVFEHFDKNSENKLKENIESLTKNGMSTRSACLQLANGNFKQMLRLQNKYRNMTQEKSQVYKFPANKTKQQKSTLSDDDIKSLFMGLVNLVKESAKNDSQQKIQKFLEQTQEDKRKQAIALEQKQFEIDRLNQSLNELKAKNISLNKTLENYRIDFVNKNPLPSH